MNFYLGALVEDMYPEQKRRPYFRSSLYWLDHIEINGFNSEYKSFFFFPLLLGDSKVGWK